MTTLGIIIGNRDFFPDILVTEARQDVLDLLVREEVEAIILDTETTPLGGVETWEDAKRCAALFAAHRAEIDGVLVVLPNFGDEKGVADALKLSGLDVPILVQAYPDDLDAFNIERRRDAFCGKVSVCNNLRQYGMPFSLTAQHTIHPSSPLFLDDLRSFLAVCRVVKGLRRARLGAIGARPGAFNTVRYSEKILQAAGISVTTVDLSEVFGQANALADNDATVVSKLESVLDYVPTPGVPSEALLRMAKLGAVIDRWIKQNDLDATALQCWNAIQQHYGVNACSLMSMMSERLMPSACEVDITGAVSMYALQLATGQPSALVDWNNNYAGDLDKCVLFHCGNWAKSFYAADGDPGEPDVHMAHADVLATTLGQANTYGALNGRVPAGPMSYLRVSTDDAFGEIRAYAGDACFTDDQLDTFGSRAVVEVPELQDLLHYICKNGFEHHVAMNPATSAAVIEEALGTYLGWETYRHS